MAKNVPNDELDLAVPIYDTSMAQCTIDALGRVLAVSTAYGEVRMYDVRASKRATSNNLIVSTAQMLSNLQQSVVNENYLYVVTQEGHPVVLDVRQNCKIVRKMPGSKGSIRDATILAQDGQEFLITGGCDRYMRVFDMTKETQADCCCGSAYLKQRINCLLVSPQQLQQK